MGTIGELVEPGATAVSAKTAAKVMFGYSQSNGALMRVTPLAVWAAEVNDLELHKKLIAAECQFTHSNPIVNDANFVYCQAIAFLLRNPNDPDKVQKAFDHAIDLSSKHVTIVFEGKSVNKVL